MALKAVVEYRLRLSAGVGDLVDLPSALAILIRDVADLDEAAHGCLARIDLRKVEYLGERDDDVE